jgi:class 3 adenylate cyclase
VASSALCPILVQRDDQLAILEEALLEARRGEGGFVVLSGEAGIGKTRLARELAREARSLGCSVLAGRCSEADLSLPYLPFVEAIGNYLDATDLERIAARLGPSAVELGQLFPKLSRGEAGAQPADAGQAKLRLFEAILSLLAIAAEDRALLLVVEDIHWADASTRELLDHLARRLAGLAAVVLVTYRADELHRTHPLLPSLQSWRRSGVAEIVELEPLRPEGVGDMLAAILGVDEVDREFRDLMHTRSEGNPFVLEEMLKEATEGGERLRAGSGATLEAIDQIGIPDTVRDSILLRLMRLDPEHVRTLEAAAVLGRTFDPAVLLEVSEAGAEVVQSAIEVAIAEQLIEERPDSPGQYRWRHALTQEAIYTETVTPRRQAIHSRAADVLSQIDSTPPVELARHLLGAGRFDEAVPVCLESAAEAERAVAFREAISLLERALPHIDDPLDSARIVGRIGTDYSLEGEVETAGRFLADGIEALERLGDPLAAARFRVILGRCHWEASQPELARQEYERARDVLATAGPSAELSLAHVRLAGLYGFELDYKGCLRESRQAVEIAERAGADFERIWALAFVALGFLDSGEMQRGSEVMDECFAEATAKGYWPIAQNVTWNDIWTRTHTMRGGLEERLERYASLPKEAPTARSYVRKARGDLEGARADAEQSIVQEERLGYSKMVWRCQVHLAEVFAELGLPEQAAEVLPPPSSRTELQDIVYDAAAQIRTRLAQGETADAVPFAREILAHADRLAVYRETLAVAAEAFLAAGDVDEVQTLIERAEAHPADAGMGYLDEMRGRLLLARDEPRAALPMLRAATDAAEDAGYLLVELRDRVQLAVAAGRSGELDQAEGLLRAAVEVADRIGARLIRREAEQAARSLGLRLPVSEEEPAEPGGGPEVLALGERLVTSLFADVRDYTGRSRESPPADLAERMTTLYRFARTAVERHHGVVDKFAGDSVMGTFNLTGTRVDHCVDALAAALALRDKAALIDLPLGIGIAAGAAVLGKGSSDANIAVRGEATNLAARLQGAARGGEILLSEEAHRRVERWLSERRIDAQREELDLKGFDGSQVGYRIPAPAEDGG